jgi:hypothetical protein
MTISSNNFTRHLSVFTTQPLSLSGPDWVCANTLLPTRQSLKLDEAIGPSLAALTDTLPSLNALMCINTTTPQQAPLQTPRTAP